MRHYRGLDSWQQGLLGWALQQSGDNRLDNNDISMRLGVEKLHASSYDLKDERNADLPVACAASSAASYAKLLPRDWAHTRGMPETRCSELPPLG